MNLFHSILTPWDLAPTIATLEALPFRVKKCTSLFLNKQLATQVNDSNFDAVVLQSQLPVLVDFWAPWCGPCRAIGPIIDELANEYEGKLSVVKLNVDESPSTPGKYGIRAIPTLILFKNGEVVEQVTGAVSKSSIATMIEQKALA